MPQQTVNRKDAHCGRCDSGRKTSEKDAARRQDDYDDMIDIRGGQSDDQMRFLLGLAFVGALALLFAVYAFSA